MIIEEEILLFIQDNLRFEFLNPIFTFITKLCDLGLIWIILALYILIIKKEKQSGYAMILGMILCVIIVNVILKNIIMRPRPFDMINELTVLIDKPYDYSFPSGHTALSFTAAIIYYYYHRNKMGILFLILAALIAYSRLYLGVHYPSDVLGGLLVALIISYITIKIMNKDKMSLMK